MNGFPPTILTSGTRDLLLSNTVRMHRKLRQTGVDAVLQVFEGQSHAQFYRDDTAPESREAFEEIAGLFDKHLGNDGVGGSNCAWPWQGSSVVRSSRLDLGRDLCCSVVLSLYRHSDLNIDQRSTLVVDFDPGRGIDHERDVRAAALWRNG